MIEKMLKPLLFALALGLSGPLAAQAAAPPAAALPDADPALWMVRDDDTTIYLFGTFHMLDGRPWFNDEVRSAFDASDELVIEAIQSSDPTAALAQTVEFARDIRRRPLSQRLTPQDNERLTRALADMNLPVTTAAPIDPWYAAISITVAAVQRAGLIGTNGPENVLSAAARARNMPIGQLESFEAQLRMLDSIPEDLQLIQLRSTLDELARLQDILRPALAAWSSGDVDALDRVLNDAESSDPRLRRIFLADRNANWVRWIRERMARPGTVFIAVGAGHLAGHDSVQVLLAQQGIRAERVPHRPD